MTCVRNQAGAKMADLRSGFAVGWQNIAPANNLLGFEVSELTKIVRDNPAIEGERLFNWRRLHKGEESLFRALRHLTRGVTRRSALQRWGRLSSSCRSTRRLTGGLDACLVMMQPLEIISDSFSSRILRPKEEYRLAHLHQMPRYRITSDVFVTFVVTAEAAQPRVFAPSVMELN